LLSWSLGSPGNYLKSTKIIEVHFHCAAQLHSDFYYNVNKSLICFKVSVLKSE
jgi:hypothetical protein